MFPKAHSDCITFAPEVGLVCIGVLSNTDLHQ
jgi:hypothetical protein